MNDIVQWKTDINRLHKEIETAYKNSLEKAWHIGKILSNVKETLPHGSFLRWVKDNCNFTCETARKYIKIKESVNSNSLDIYNSITHCLEDITEKEKQTKKISAGRDIYTIMLDRHSTGKVPQDWNNDCETEWPVFCEEQERKEKRIEQIRIEAEQRQAEREEKEAADEEYREKLHEAAKQMIDRETLKQQEREKYNSVVKDMATLYDVIDDYVSSMTNSQRLECYNNVIRYCKAKAIELNRNA